MSLTQEQLHRLTRTVMQQLDEWKLSLEQMTVLLDMPDTIKARMMPRYREDMAFPDEPQILKRAELILRIADALRTTYPTSPQMRSIWMQRANRRFNQQSPLGFMINAGESGLVNVLCQLDCTYAWDCSGSQTSSETTVPPASLHP